jgi:hypothetical protein
MKDKALIYAILANLLLGASLIEHGLAAFIDLATAFAVAFLSISYWVKVLRKGSGEE